MSKEPPKEESHHPLNPLQLLDEGMLLAERTLDITELGRLKEDLALLKKFSTKETLEAKKIKASLSEVTGSIGHPTRLSTVIDIFKEDGLDYNKALIAAVYEGNIEVARVLLENGANIHYTASENKTPLSIACDPKGKILPDMVTLLKNNGAKKEDIKDNSVALDY